MKGILAYLMALIVLLSKELVDCACVVNVDCILLA